MPGTVITNSPNLTLLNSKIVADICEGIFLIDVTPSAWITDTSLSPYFNGAANVQGAKIQITNPYGVIIKSYGSGFDIAPPMTGIYEYNIPTQAGKVQYGTYTIDIELTDSDSPGTKYYVSKTVNVCTYNKDQNPCDDRLSLVASCKNGTLGVYLSEPPLFKGFYSESRTQTIVVNYPTASGHAVTNSAFGNFSVQLFEGVYKVVVTVCATYNLTDNVYLRLPYSVTMEKNVKCTLDYTCIWPRIKQLWDKINSDCSEADRQLNSAIALEASLLIPTIEIANDAGEDASDYISQLETLLGCVCTCDCTGSPIVNGTPSTDLAIEGCGFTKTTVGLTDIYTFTNGEYTLEVNDSLGVITYTPVAVDGCERTQTISYNPTAAYAAIKARVNNTTEYNFWANIINQPLNDIDASCLGYTSLQWTALTFKEKFEAVMNKACTGGNCDAVVVSSASSRNGADILLSWVTTDAVYVQIWVDGDFVDAKNAAITSITLPGFADGNEHTYEIKPFCINNVEGVSSGGSFEMIGCATIVPPTVSSSLASNVTCPYNLTGLVLALPSGIFAEWHTANNTLAATLVADPTLVSDGIYYVFAKDSNNCYSTGVQVIVTCSTSSTVTAPQNLEVIPQFGSYLVRFQSAAYPPVANSYTLKRRLSSDPDISGSYTTLGSTGTGINWNSSTSRWELSDATAVADTLYVYRAISNGGTSPYIDLTYANITCPAITLGNTLTTVTYSFPPTTGEVDKYVIELYDSTETTLLDSDIILEGSPTFVDPTTGSFTGLTAGTAYKVRAKVYIGTYFTTCAFYSIVAGADTITGTTYMNLSSPTMAGTIVINDPAGSTLRFTNFSVCGLANAQIIVSGGIGTINNNITSGAPSASQNVDTFLPAGTYTYTGTLTSGCTSAAGIVLI